MYHDRHRGGQLPSVPPALLVGIHRRKPIHVHQIVTAYRRPSLWLAFLGVKGGGGGQDGTWSLSKRRPLRISLLPAAVPTDRAGANARIGTGAFMLRRHRRVLATLPQTAQRPSRLDGSSRIVAGGVGLLTPRTVWADGRARGKPAGRKWIRTRSSDRGDRSGTTRRLVRVHGVVDAFFRPRRRERKDSCGTRRPSSFKNILTYIV
jgi:hypothetical protein